MKKVAIVTFAANANYGSILQAFALQYILKSHYRVDVFSPYSRPLFANLGLCLRLSFKHPVGMPSDFRLVLSKIRHPFIWQRNRKRQKMFDEFRTREMGMGRLLRVAKMSLLNSEYDAFVSGGDQVWNLLLSQNDPTYMLSFVRESSKKVSYSVSLGTASLPPQCSKTLLTYASLFPSCHMREESGKQIMEQNGLEADVVLDPVLLLTKFQWEKLEQAPSFAPVSDFIFVYQVFPDSLLLKKAMEYALLHHFQVYVVNYSFRPIPGATNLFCLDPLALVWMLDHAKAVFVSSFHGLALSACLGKEFFYTRLHREDGYGDDRALTLVNLLGIKGRQISSSFDFSAPLDAPDSFQPQLEKERERCLTILEHDLSQAVNR